MKAFTWLTLAFCGFAAPEGTCAQTPEPSSKASVETTHTSERRSSIHGFRGSLHITAADRDRAFHRTPVVFLAGFDGYGKDANGECDIAYSIIVSCGDAVVFKRELIDRSVENPFKIRAEKWDVPPDAPVGMYRVALAARDNIGGSGFAKNYEITVEALPTARPREDFEAKNDLIVFVGRRLEINNFEDPFSTNPHRLGRYEVLQLIHGRHEGKIIEFAAYDHEGGFEFTRFETVLLFVFRRSGKLYHVSHQFFDVYPTKNGRWATCGDPYKYESAGNRPEPVRDPLRAVPIEFAGAVSESKSGEQCKEGNYVEDLWELKKRGVLTNWGHFTYRWYSYHLTKEAPKSSDGIFELVRVSESGDAEIIYLPSGSRRILKAGDPTRQRLDSIVPVRLMKSDMGSQSADFEWWSTK